MIILEGPDGGGKTTLGKHLSEQSGMELFHSGGPIHTPEECTERIWTQLDQYGKIVDRCSVFSEPIYGIAIRNHSMLPLYQFESFIQMMADRNWTLIFCVADGPIIEGKEWKSEEHMRNVYAKKDMIFDLYMEMYKHLEQMDYPRLFMYDWQGNDVPADVYARYVLWRAGYVRA